jgi:hypothetical protein
LDTARARYRDGDGVRFGTGRAGRPPQPRFRTARNRRCVTFDGKIHNFGPDHTARAVRASRAFRTC